MTDERLDAGRHHLREGERALAERDVHSSRGFFEAAILQFAGPDLKMGEGHALRGLASVAVADGDMERAESLLHAAIGCFRTVRTLLDALDDDGRATAHRVDAMEAEAITQVQLGEHYLRSGRVAEAQEVRDWARSAFDGVGSRPSEAGVWALTGHVALRQGNLDEASVAYNQALAIHAQSGDKRGQVGVIQALSEISRLRSDAEACAQHNREALALAKDLQDPTLEARTLSAMGLQARQRGEHDSAILAYEAAMRLAESIDDRESQGFAHLNLGDVRSRGQRGQPVMHFRRAAELLTSVGAEHGLGSTLLHGADHAYRAGHPDLALALAVGAQRIWQTMDPVRGVGHALRIIVKALAPQAPNEALLLVATYREQLVGDLVPHAGDVADYYRARVSTDDLVRSEAMPPEERSRLCTEYVADKLMPMLGAFGVTYSDLGTARAALVLLDELATRPDQRGLVDVDSADLAPMPDEDAYYVLTEADLLPPEGRS